MIRCRLPQNASVSPTTSFGQSLSQRRILATWWPLAASWLLMAMELPALSAIVARLPNPETNLAAYGGIVFPLSLIIEAPIIMLLAASTAVCRDCDSYTRLRRYMMAAGASLTALHVIVAFTPIYDVVALKLLGAPAAILEPGRIGLRIMTPWTWSIAYRRFNQGVLIRFGHSRSVGAGTLVRLATDLLVLLLGYQLGTIPGIIVGTSAVAAGVISEAIFAGIRVRPVLRDQLQHAPPAEEPLRFVPFMRFYIPLAMTSLLLLLSQPMGAAAMSRMPQALESLAAWPVLSGLVFMFRSLGMAFNEVVVALLDEPHAVQSLQRFTGRLVLSTSIAIFAVAATPLADLWFADVSALSLPLSNIASAALLLALPLPALNVLHSWYQGILVNSRRTRGITEAVAIFLLVSGIAFGGGILWNQITGLYATVIALDLGAAAQALWLHIRSRTALREVAPRAPEVTAIRAADLPAQIP